MSTKTGRGIAVIAGAAAMAATIPPTVLLIRQWAPGAPGAEIARSAVPAICALLGGAVFLALRAVRSTLSQRYVAACVARGTYDPYRSPAFGVTLIAWLVAVVSVSVSFAAASVISNEDPVAAMTDFQQAHRPVFLALSVLGVVAAAIGFSWVHRRRHEVPALEAAGVVRRVTPPPQLPPADAARLRLRMYGKGVLIEAMFTGVALLGGFLPGHERPTEDKLIRGVLTVVGGPAIVGVALLAMLLVFAPTRRTALAALRQPASLTAIGLFGAGY